MSRPTAAAAAAAAANGYCCCRCRLGNLGTNRRRLRYDPNTHTCVFIYINIYKSPSHILCALFEPSCHLPFRCTSSPPQSAPNTVKCACCIHVCTCFTRVFHTLLIYTRHFSVFAALTHPSYSLTVHCSTSTAVRLRACDGDGGDVQAGH